MMITYHIMVLLINLSMVVVVRPSRCSSSMSPACVTLLLCRSVVDDAFCMRVPALEEFQVDNGIYTMNLMFGEH